MNSILIAINVMRRLLREITSLGFIFIFPIIAAIFAVLMFGGTKTIDVGFVDLQKNDYGLINYLEKSGKYTLQMVKEENIEELVRNKDIKYGIIFPDQIEEHNKIRLISREEEEDALNLKGELEGYLGAAINGNPPSIDEGGKSFKEIDKQNKAKLALGMIAMFIIMFIGTGMQLLLEDKRVKTFMRSFCAPIKEYEIALGHLLANFFLGILQIGIFLFVTTVIFRFDFGTSIMKVFFLLVVFLITAIGLGIGVVGFVRDGEKYNLMVTIIAVTMSFIGGAFFPMEFMNGFIQKLSNITPQKWLIEAFVKLSEGQGLLDIGNEVLILLLFGLVFFTFGVKALRLTSSDL